MSEYNGNWLRYLFEGHIGQLIAVLLGAFIRGFVGDDPWSWKEFLQAIIVGFIFILWVGPGIAETFELGSQTSVSIGVAVGMVALPLTRGLIALVRQFRDDPGGFVRCLIAAWRGKK